MSAKMRRGGRPRSAFLQEFMRRVEAAGGPDAYLRRCYPDIDEATWEEIRNSPPIEPLTAEDLKGLCFDLQPPDPVDFDFNNDRPKHARRPS